MTKAYFFSSLQPSCQEGTNLILLVGKLAQRRKVIVWSDPERKCQSHCNFCALSTLHSSLFSGGGDCACTCAHGSETGNGIGVGCLLAVRFLIGVKASLLETILWGGTKPTKCFSRLLAFPLKTEHTSGSDLRALWLDNGVGWGWGWGERQGTGASTMELRSQGS